jgi:hypothetical protein
MIFTCKAGEQPAQLIRRVVPLGGFPHFANGQFLSGVLSEVILICGFRGMPISVPN